MFFAAKYINFHKLFLNYFKAVVKKYDNSCTTVQLSALFIVVCGPCFFATD